ncbi:MAG TPA: hypothetical protein VFF68_05395 [Anaerolineaceae bacterium]|nr:hypothetical protein [Anaerolineaceae bacterium]
MTPRGSRRRRSIRTYHLGLMAIGLLAALAIITYQFRAPQSLSSAELTRPTGVPPVIRPEVLHPGLLPAFPGAAGAGAATPGGRGGQVLAVTNLNDRGPGSLRAAINTPGPRTVIFQVSGVIELERPLVILEPFLTIAGQTAPGGGITLSGTKNQDGEMIVLHDVHDVVIRYLRIRNGQLGTPGQGQTNIAIDSGAHNIVIDHVSLSWSLDENVMIHRNIPDGISAEDWPEISAITVQRSLIAEGLHPHSTGIQTGGENAVEGWRGVKDITIHHNLFAHNSHRNPGLGSLHTQIINNVMYNWAARAGETWRNIDVDWIGNYFKPGPMSASGLVLVHVAYPANDPDHPWPAPSLFVGGNLAPPDFADPGGDNWGLYRIHYDFTPVPAAFRRTEPQPFTAVPVEIHTAEEAYHSVLADVGANARLNCSGVWVDNLDRVDQRLLADVERGTGPQRRPIADAAEVGGLPELETGAPCPDGDADGMPDEFERTHPPLDPESPDDGGNDLHPQYTNLEIYLNGVSGDGLAEEVSRAGGGQ